MKVFMPINQNGNVEIRPEKLKELLADAYQDGYAKGQIDQILSEAPKFEIADARKEQRKKQFSVDGKLLIFRATID